MAALTPLLAAAALILPVPGGQLTNSFHDPRDGGARAHEGVDIMAPLGTPVVAAAAGRVAKLYLSVRGGLCVYQWLPDGRVLVYTHLQAYAPGLTDGQAVAAGQPLGAVGHTGDAEAGPPHLHFEVGVPLHPGQYWGAAPVDPYLLLTGRR